MADLNRSQTFFALMFIASLLLVIFGLAVMSQSHIDDNQLLYFEKVGNEYVAEIVVKEPNQDYYLVSNHLNKINLPGISSVRLEIISDTNPYSLLLKPRNSVSSSKAGPDSRNIVTVYEDFSINEAGHYQMIIKNIKSFDTIGEVSFTLHGNSNQFFQGAVTIVGILMLLCSTLAGFVYLLIGGMKELLKLKDLFKF